MLAVAFFEDSGILFTIGLVLLILFVWYFATEIEQRKRNIGSVLLIGVVTLCLASVFPLKERLKGGIDILGGSAFTLRVQQRETEDGKKETVTRREVDQAIKVIEQRLNGTGTSEPLIAAQGDDKIIVQMPGVSPEEEKKIRETLERVAHLELRQVHQNTMQLAPAIQAGTELAPPGYKLFTEEHRTMRMAMPPPRRSS
ncbi:MAG: hypothetical protein QM755_16760 [Luteolibacter sp.]